ncbi:MAG: glycosyl hydrolase family 18 protein [Clostridiales bacterium]|nr:glycosyl hydrolase family 18 protein [Clostridiales bacterium]
MLIHVVKPNETISSIAAQYGVSPQRLMYDNAITDPTRLVVGQALLVLFPSKVHLVQENETLYSIATDYQVSVLSLVRNNPFVVEQENIYPGDSIVISYDTKKERTIRTNGYVYPQVTYDTLVQTLPFLTTISIFSYGFTMEGDLIPTDDEDIIEISRKYGVDPILVLTPLDETYGFNNELVSVISQDEAVQNNLISQLLAVVEEKRYSGVDVDFEFIKGEDAEGFANFVRRLRETLNEQGYSVSVALAPKTSADQVGLIYEGMNYALLGEAANSALLMTYEWGYTYGPPLAVAPLDQVTRVVDFGVSQIEANRLDLGMANYGYDWALPFEKGVTRARNIGNLEAIEIAFNNYAEIQFDEVAQSPFFTYTNNGVDHIVWFEDVRSILGKLKLMEARGMRGLGYWQLMRYFRPNWMLVNALFDIE